MKQFLAYVAVENVAYHFDILYSYKVPEELADKVKAGSLVSVPFGRSKSVKRQGIVFSVDEMKPDTDGKRLKSIISLIDYEIAGAEALDIALFLKDRTFCTFFEAVKVQIPSGFNFKTTVKYFALASEKEINLSAEEKQVYDFMLTVDGFLDKSEIYNTLGFSKDCGILDKLFAKKLVTKDYNAVRNMKAATMKMVCLSENYQEVLSSFARVTPKQKEVINVLEDISRVSVKELCYFTGVTTSVINNLAKKGILQLCDEAFFRIPETQLTARNSDKPILLTDKQKNAYNALIEKYHNGGGVSLLYGVTGSGKTSVFLSLIDKVISDERQVIVMVPEISLTPQMMAQFKGRYGSAVAIFHSALSAGERRDEYVRVKEGIAKVVIGTRSAVFAPLKNIGLIVIDEEQEHTYKSESSPRYDAKDVAKFRAYKHNALLLLSSATPSIESYNAALRGKYDLQVLDERYGDAVLPEVSVVDMKADRASGNKYNISSELLELLDKNLENKKQSILLINRRGYNTFVVCDSCSNVVTCPSCSISLTYHTANNRLMCHYCGYSVPFTKHCNECGKDTVRYAGYGTQRIEEELSSLIPEARVLRMDTDTTSTRNSFEKGLVDFGEGKYDIMLGTQMVAKGLNFENVTLVGVINADQQLNNDDFKSQERTFDLLTQVVGRSGRGKDKGVAVIQTLTPENHVIKLAQTQDYDSFYRNEIVIRKTMVYPPYCDICSVLFTSGNEVKALNCSRDFLKKLRELLTEKYKEEKIIVLGPMPPRVSKINNKFRFRLIIKCKNSKRFRNMISEMLIDFGKNKNYNNVTVSADINPENLI